MSKQKFLRKEIKNELMLYDTENDAFHILNPTARLIYKYFEEARDLAEIEILVKRHFKIDAGQDIRSDIHRCFQEMKNKGLLINCDL